MLSSQLTSFQLGRSSTSSSDQWVGWKQCIPDLSAYSTACFNLYCHTPSNVPPEGWLLKGQARPGQDSRGLTPDFEKVKASYLAIYTAHEIRDSSQDPMNISGWCNSELSVLICGHEEKKPFLLMQACEPRCLGNRNSPISRLAQAT